VNWVDPEEMPHLPCGRGYQQLGTENGVVLNSSMNWHEVSIHTTPNSYPKSATPKMAQVLEDLPQVVCYGKNQGLGFTIPYSLSGQQKNYTPDFIVRLKDGRSDLLNLMVEVSGAARIAVPAIARTCFA